MNRCRLCVIPDTRPDTAFIDGICSACIAYAARPGIDWKVRREQLIALIARARAVANSRGNHFDCIVPSSGGKDSTYQVLTLLELDCRPLVVTATTCHLTDIGRKNLDNLARYATTVEITPNMAVRAKLNRLGLSMVGDISWPEHVGIFTTPFKAAHFTCIPFIFYGENPQNQYGGPIEATEAVRMTRRWVSEFGGFLGLRPQDLVGSEGLTEADLADYMLPPNGISSDIESHFLGQYIPWDSHRNAEISRNAGMQQVMPSQANWWYHENLDNAQTGLHDYGMYRKFGFGRAAAQLSVDIRAGRVTRETAMEWLAMKGGTFPWRYCGVHLDQILQRIGMTKEKLWPVLDRFTNWSIFRRVEDRADAMPILLG